MKQQSATVTPLKRRQTAFGRLLDEAPYLPRCSDNKTAAVVRPREYATRYPYMQVNRPGMVSWLVFDLDHPNPFVWDDAGLPAPNFIVSNRKSRKAHLYYAIPPVCTSERGRSKPIQYLKAVYEAMAIRLQADPSYSGPVAKTPHHPWWSTTELHNHEYPLGELADYLDLSVKPLWSTGPNLDAVAHSRHCTLFEELRFYAYSVVASERESGTYSHFCKLLEAYAHNRNNFQTRGFAAPLTIAQVKATVKSVARWTWDRYTGRSDCHRGVMALDDSLPIYERQRLAAQRTHQRRRTATEGRIRKACRELHKTGRKLTQTAVATAAGVARQTVARYQKLFDEVLHETAPVTPIRAPSAYQRKPVTYAVYQISAVLRVNRLGPLWGKLIDSLIKGSLRLRLFPLGLPPD